MNGVNLFPEFIENTVSVSRNHHEALNIKQGNSAYGILASVIDTNIVAIDSTAEYLAKLAASGVVRDMYDKQHFNPKYGEFKNFLTRNIYLSPDKKEKMELNRTLAGAATMMATEFAVKWGARGIQHLASEEDKYITLNKVYSILYCFANNDCSDTNTEKANVELTKILGAFPLTDAKKAKMKRNTKSANILSLSELDISLIYNMDNSVLENISYLLFSIYCQKYKDVDGNEDKLIDYYNLLGYHTNVAKELIHENRNTYEQVSSDQRKYLAIARGMVNNLFIDKPEFDLTQISQVAQEMAKYDPYDIRRKKVNTVAKSGVLTVAGLFTKNPAMVMSAASEALSQFTLDDDGKEAARTRLKGWGIDEGSISHIFNHSNDIRSTAQEMINEEK